MAQKNPQRQSLGYLLREQAEKIGARTLLRFEGESMSFAQVEEGNLKPRIQFAQQSGPFGSTILA